MKSAKKLMMIAMVGIIALGIVGCGFLDNKAEKVLGLGDATMKDALGDLGAATKMAEQLKGLSIGDMLSAQNASEAIMAKLKAEWIPQLKVKATELGVKDFAVSFDEDEGEGVLVLPEKDSGKFSGVVQGVATADGDKAEFIFRISATIVNGKVSYTFKR